MVLGGAPATQPYVKASQIFSVIYFVYFLFLLFIVPYVENYFLKYFKSEIQEMIKKKPRKRFFIRRWSPQRKRKRRK